MTQSLARAGPSKVRHDRQKRHTFPLWNIRLRCRVLAIDITLANPNIRCRLGFPGLAQSFVNYMAYLFTDPTWGISSVASKGASKLLQQVHDGLVALQQQPASGGQSFQQANPGEWQILYETYLSFVSLGDPSDTGNANWQVQFDAASLAANAKRDLSERQACTLPSSSGSGTCPIWRNA